MTQAQPHSPPVASHSLYQEREAVLATMHGKEATIAPLLGERLGLTVLVPEGIDTDALGTFTGEIPRHGTIKEAAVAKARLGMAATGLPIGIASEGAYGPHPHIPFLAAGIELLVFVDDERGIIVSEHLIDEATNFAHVVADTPEGIGEFLPGARFPEHGLVVSPNAPSATHASIFKGIRTRAALDEAIRLTAAASSDGRALVQTDMRAHQNPTRMAAISRLAARLVQRLLALCPDCAMPGFGLIDVVKGLPCEVCDGPSTLVRYEIYGCTACDHKEQRPRSDGLLSAEQRWCSLCNP
jgi:hypothetical protein